MKGIIGAICGDIIGSTREFNSIKTKDFELVEEYSTFTDDSVLTLAVASWLINDEDHHRRNLVKEIQNLARKYPHAGYGGRFRQWINMSNPHPYRSWGNGSAMRVSPVAWACESLEETQLLAKKSAEVTHNHPEGIKGAVATASAIFMARMGKSKKYIKEYIESVFGYNLSRRLDDIRPTYGFEVSCQKSVPESIICFLESDSYIDTIRNAVSLGGDADTMAAISGSIAAAYYDVPEKLVDDCLEVFDVHLWKIYQEFSKKFNDNPAAKIFSNIKGDVPFETIEFDDGVMIFIEYVNDKNSSSTNYNGKYTCKYRKIKILGTNPLPNEKFEENPYYSEEANHLNNKWQKSNATEQFNENAIQVIHEGLELDEIKERINNDESYLVVLWKKGNPPVPIDLGLYKDVTLSLIDDATTLSELTFNVIYSLD